MGTRYSYNAQCPDRDEEGAFQSGRRRAVGKKHCACHPQVWESSHKRKERTQPDPNVSLPETDGCGKCERLCPVGDAVPFCQRLSSAHSAPFFFQPNSVKVVTWNFQGKEHIRLTASSLSRGEVLKMKMGRTENVTKAKKNLEGKNAVSEDNANKIKCICKEKSDNALWPVKKNLPECGGFADVGYAKKQPVFKLRFFLGL